MQHSTLLCPLVFLACWLALETFASSPTGSDLKRRGSAFPCPEGQHRQYQWGGTCLPNLPNPCKLACVHKPYVPASPFLPKQEPSVCLHSGYPKAGNPTFVDSDQDNQTKSWKIQNMGELVFNRNGDEYFDGSITKDGKLQMRSYGKASISSNYFVALKVGEWIYYYSLKGYGHCETPAPDAKDEYTLLERVTVYRDFKIGD